METKNVSDRHVRKNLKRIGFKKESGKEGIIYRNLFRLSIDQINYEQFSEYTIKEVEQGIFELVKLETSGSTLSKMTNPRLIKRGEFRQVLDAAKIAVWFTNE